MHFIPIQMICIGLLMCCTGDAANKKRSPLEIGYVSFTEIPIKHKQISHANSPIPTGKTAKNILHPRHVWVPGHVSHHAFIPAHHAVLPPNALLVTRTVHTLLVRPREGGFEIFEDDPFRRAYGGYGVGVDVGGHGAGHGFHVII